MALMTARATRLPIYSSFAKEGILSDLFAKREAISTLFNVLGIGVPAFILHLLFAPPCKARNITYTPAGVIQGRINGFSRLQRIKSRRPVTISVIGIAHGGRFSKEAIAMATEYTINVVPSELFLKFHKKLEGLRVGINIEDHELPFSNDI